ncbi:transposase family protein [Streptomyces syringium]|uniref:transposase family protein n=1 Tax=Streptomyces syringium TaxID=76729 RepID=UPI0037CE4CE8
MRAVGAGARDKLVFVDRLLATLVHLRHGTTHDVLACWSGVDRSTITGPSAKCGLCRPSGAARPLPGSGCATSPTSSDTWARAGRPEGRS